MIFSLFSLDIMLGLLCNWVWLLQQCFGGEIPCRWERKPDGHGLNFIILFNSIPSISIIVSILNQWMICAHNLITLSQLVHFKVNWHTQLFSPVFFFSRWKYYILFAVKSTRLIQYENSMCRNFFFQYLNAFIDTTTTQTASLATGESYKTGKFSQTNYPYNISDRLLVLVILFYQMISSLYASTTNRICVTH